MYFNREYLRKRFISNKNVINDSTEKIKYIQTIIEEAGKSFSEEETNQKQFEYQTWHEKFLTQSKNNREIEYCLKVLDPILYSTIEQKDNIIKELENEFELEIKRRKHAGFFEGLKEYFTENEIETMEPDMLEQLKKDYDTILNSDEIESENSDENEDDHEEYSETEFLEFLESIHLKSPPYPAQKYNRD